MTAHFLEFNSQLDEALIRVNRADRIDQTALNMRLLRALERRVNRNLEVANVIESIKNTEYTNAMLRCLLDELFHDIIGVMIITKQVLTTEKHLDRSFEILLQNIQTLPRIFIKEAQAAIKRSTAPCFKRIVANGIKCRKLWKHIRNSHAGCQQ